MSQSQALWNLGRAEALSLQVGPGPRELQVTSGRLWLTQRGSTKAPATDIWMEAGDTLALPSGTQLVLEAWPAASFQLLVPPAACPALRQRQTRTGGLSVGLQAASA
ncbi:DUF2917 domain-containing protein [Paucibacter sp. APW11]|uniref:DUF2917 domain-containing protein n=1 Tax=Roseateles aquae TaxID=3077235 RepID=A0ABU3PAT7_9BURK|nr:DUF2917 domain-containing protein [Paucibacter sp. APW11]MDT8999659.1 DUF2917 domain-containing protein [Paucibacter sp. APW11]